MRERELAQIEERPIPVSQTIQDLPEAVDVAIMRSLEKDPDDRFQRASDFIAALLPVLRDLARSEFHEAFSFATDSDRRRAFRPGGQGRPMIVIDGNLTQGDAPTETRRAGPTICSRRGMRLSPVEGSAALASPETIPAPFAPPPKPPFSPSPRPPHVRAAPEPHPQDVGRYRILELIGEGTVGPLYQAYDRLDGRPAALKLISRHFPVATTERDRFLSRRAGLFTKHKAQSTKQRQICSPGTGH